MTSSSKYLVAVDSPHGLEPKAFADTREQAEERAAAVQVMLDETTGQECGISYLAEDGTWRKL